MWNDDFSERGGMDFDFIIIGLVTNGLLSFIGAYIASEKGRSGAAFLDFGPVIVLSDSPRHRDRCAKRRAQTVGHLSQEVSRL